MEAVQCPPDGLSVRRNYAQAVERLSQRRVSNGFDQAVYGHVVDGGRHVEPCGLQDTLE
jgi:hypothetical protein